MIDLEEEMRAAVSDFRKAAYEFAQSHHPEDHKSMMDAQVRIFALYRASAAPQVVADERAHEIMNSMAVHVDDWADSLDYEPSKTEVSGKALRYILSRAAAPVQAQEPVRLDTEQSREYLVQFMEQHFTDKTYHRYIRGQRPGVNLAGDFAWQMARALRMIVAPVQPVAVPDGWALVPIDPTDAMLSAIAGTRYDQLHPSKQKAERDAYTKFLLGCAVPAAPAAQGDAKDTERLRWLAETGARISWSMDGEYCAVWLPDDRDGTESRPAEGYPLKCYDSWHRAIDAAIAAKAAS